MLVNRLIYILVLIGDIAAYAITSSGSFLIIAIILLLIPILSIIYISIMHNKSEISINCTNITQIRGERLEQIITVNNNSRLPIVNLSFSIGIRYEINGVVDIKHKRVSVAGYDKLVIREKFKLEYVGKIESVVINTMLTDPLNLFRIRLREVKGREQIVMPVSAEFDYYSLNDYRQEIKESSEYSKKRKGNDPSEVFDYREYENGDSLNRVHWKLTAKSDNIMVKEFSQPIKSPNIFLVDLIDTGNKKFINGIFDMVHSLSNLAILKETSFSLVYYSEKRECLMSLDVSGKTTYEEALGVLISDKVGNELKSLDYYLAENTADGRLYYITSDTDGGLVDRVSSLTCDATVYSICDEENEGNIINLGNVSVLSVNYNDVRWAIDNTVL
ncbi:MAG: DUF58 domain-containing protein [Eubacteriales bacterium]|nr:DUF58 domain-containing protein [Eubacteriales bacterium]